MKKLLLFISIFFLGISYVYAANRVELVKCVDGDTLKVSLDDKEYTVRMLAIDTPELAKDNKEEEYYAKEASDYTCNKLKKAKKIELEYDLKSDKFDKYDRLLAWVFVDGKLLQEDLVKNGYAKVAYLYDEYKYADMLKDNQELASAKELGIWNKSNKDKFDNEDDKEDIYMNIEVIILGILVMIGVFILRLFGKK